MSSWPDTASLPLKIAATIVATLVLWAIARLARDGGGSRGVRTRFWLHHSARIFLTVSWLAVIAWVWVRDTSRIGTIAAVITAGLTVALQKVVTSVAGYFAILRGNTFTVGDRITMGGVRGDVVALDYLRTTIMEMGQPPAVQDAEPAMWIAGRQYTGRIVTITNDKIFDTPVYNYTREFPFMWEELRVPVRHGSDWTAAEHLLLAAAEAHTREIVDAAREALPRLLQRFTLFEEIRVTPETFVHLTDNWIELTVRFIARDHGVRALKSAISRDVLARLAEAKIAIASETIDVSISRSV